MARVGPGSPPFDSARVAGRPRLKAPGDSPAPGAARGAPPSPPSTNRLHGDIGHRVRPWRNVTSGCRPRSSAETRRRPGGRAGVRAVDEAAVLHLGPTSGSGLPRSGRARGRSRDRSRPRSARRRAPRRTAATGSRRVALAPRAERREELRSSASFRSAGQVDARLLPGVAVQGEERPLEGRVEPDDQLAARAGCRTAGPESRSSVKYSSRSGGRRCRQRLVPIQSEDAASPCTSAIVGETSARLTGSGRRVPPPSAPGVLHEQRHPQLLLVHGVAVAVPPVLPELLAVVRRVEDRGALARSPSGAARRRGVGTRRPPGARSGRSRGGPSCPSSAELANRPWCSGIRTYGVCGSTTWM